jgi:chorismate dehydratase
MIFAFIIRSPVLTFATKINTKDLDREIRVGAVSYLNTKPLLYGIQHSTTMESIRLTIDYPAKIASLLLNGEIDIGLVPVSIIPQMKEYHVNTDYCIGSDGPVASVCLFSEVPLDKVERVLLDYQSRTSVQLARILLREYWRVSPELIDAKTDFREQIKGTTAAVVIGDRALEQRRISSYSYDLGEAWKLHTGLPFVFAAWISNKRLDDPFVKQFNEANRFGLDHLPLVIAELTPAVFDLNAYYTRYISYPLDEAKKQGLDLFIQKLQKKPVSGLSH